MPESTEMHHGPVGGGQTAQVIAGECVGLGSLERPSDSKGCLHLGPSELALP